MPLRRAQKLACIVSPQHDTTYVAETVQAHLMAKRMNSRANASLCIEAVTNTGRALKALMRPSPPQRPDPQALHSLGHGPRLPSHAGFLAARHDGQPADWLPVRWLSTTGVGPRNSLFIRDPHTVIRRKLEMNCIRCHTTGGQPRPQKPSSGSSRVWPTWAFMRGLPRASQTARRPAATPGQAPGRVKNSRH
ncbi:MAG: hypothetical protein CM1200mP29_01590 [Verrucomicrobiota bacterium]|nr:MAG: hypothetical protein CM1200mP29_01590 [Verrucomicrobiota bacterium]